MSNKESKPTTQIWHICWTVDGGKAFGDGDFSFNGPLTASKIRELRDFLAEKSNTTPHRSGSISLA